nr:hypothetical protein [Tanacetum cinerariifolium]
MIKKWDIRKVFCRFWCVRMMIKDVTPSSGAWTEYGIRNVSPNGVFGNEVYGGDSKGFSANHSSDEFRLCNSDEWRSINGGGPLGIHGYGGGGDMVIRIHDQPTTYATESTRGYITSLQGIRNESPLGVFGNEVYDGSKGFGVNHLSDEFRLCNSDEWRSINDGGHRGIRGHGSGGDMERTRLSVFIIRIGEMRVEMIGMVQGQQCVREWKVFRFNEFMIHKSEVVEKPSDSLDCNGFKLFMLYDLDHEP